MEEASPVFILMSRLLIIMITLLVIIIPWSERYSALDSFPNGHDTELNFLAVFVFLGLILLFVHASKKRLRHILALKCLLFAIIRPALFVIPDSYNGLVLTDAHHPPLPALSPEMYNLPLQI